MKNRGKVGKSNINLDRGERGKTKWRRGIPKARMIETISNDKRRESPSSV